MKEAEPLGKFHDNMIQNTAGTFLSRDRSDADLLTIARSWTSPKGVLQPESPTFLVTALLYYSDLEMLRNGICKA